MSCMTTASSRQLARSRERRGLRHSHHRRPRESARLGARDGRPGLASGADRHRRQLRPHDRRRAAPHPRRVWWLRRWDPGPMTNVLSLLVVIPLAGLIPLFLFRRDERAAKQVAITTTFVELVVSLWMVKQFVIGEPGFQLVEKLEWLPSLGISYLVGVDGISVLLVPMTTLLTFIAVLYSSGGAIKTRIVEYMTAFLLPENGMGGVFIPLAPFLFYLFSDLMLVPMYLIIGIWGGPRRI